MTQQEQFEADYLAAFPMSVRDLNKFGGEYVKDIATFAFAVWLQQAKRHEAEKAELVATCKQALYALKGREHDQFLRDAITKYEVKNK